MTPTYNSIGPDVDAPGPTERAADRPGSEPTTVSGPSLTVSTWTEARTCSCSFDGPVVVHEVRRDYSGTEQWTCPKCGLEHLREVEGIDAHRPLDCACSCGERFEDRNGLILHTRRMLDEPAGARS